MSRVEFVELVEFIRDRWGMVDAWANAEHVVADFEPVSAEAVWEVLKNRMTGDPGKARWAPNPPELLALSLDWMRARMAPPALPETTELYGWREYCRRTYGQVISFQEAIERAADV